MTVYSATDDWRERRDLLARRITGQVAMYRLLVAQREASQGDVAYARDRLERALGDRAAHAESPPGTAFVARVAGAPGRIWVVAAGGKTVYEGPAEGYATGAVEDPAS